MVACEWCVGYISIMILWFFGNVARSCSPTKSKLDYASNDRRDTGSN